MTVQKPNIRNTYRIDWQIEKWGRGKMAPAPEYVVVHFTGSGEGGNASTTYRSWTSVSKDRRGNTHYLVDAAGIYECVDPKKYACKFACASKRCDQHLKYYEKGNGHPSKYACTHIKLAGNFNTINIETCSSKRTPVSNRPNSYMDTDFYFPNETYKNLVALVSWLLDTFGIPLGNLIMHHNISGKLCPAMWCNNDAAFNGWAAFKKDVASVLNKAPTASDLPKPTSKGTAAETEMDGTISVKRGDLIYMEPGGIVTGYFDGDATLEYTAVTGGYYYTKEGYVKGDE